ncbi:NHL repeat-containing protein [candidate division KSB1 bacterium]
MKNIIKIIFTFLLIIFTGDLYAFQGIEFNLEAIFGERGNAPGEFNSPMSLSIDLQGNIYIADTGNNRIQKLTDRGEFERQIGGYGWNIDQFDEPVSIWAKDGLNLYIADRNNHRIVQYDRNLNFVSKIEGQFSGNTDINFNFPAGLYISNTKEVFVSDSEKNRIVRFDRGFDFLQIFGDHNSSSYPILDAGEIYINDSEKVYVVDKIRNEIIEFDYFGNYIGSFGKDHIKSPYGITADKNKNIYVCDLIERSVLIFNASGSLISRLDHISMKAPVDVDIKDNLVFVLDMESSNIYVFRMSEK